MDIEKNKILFVEDDVSHGYLLMDYLESNDFNVSLFRDGESGLNAFRNNHFDLCILDIMLPAMDGLTLSVRIKEINPDIPVIFLTAKSLKHDKIKGLKLGADDYVTKPFDEEELLLRIKAVLKRTQIEIKHKATSVYKIGKFTFDHKNQLLRSSGDTKRLTKTESNVLKCLCMNKNNIILKNDLLESVWGDDDYFTGRSLDVFISKLRKHLKKDPCIKIDCIPKVGLILTDRELD